MNGVAILPESAQIRNLIIKNHEVQLPQGLFCWLKSNLNDHKTIIPMMEQQGIDWWGAAEYMATEMERDYNIAWLVFFLAYRGIATSECEDFAKSPAGWDAKKVIIHAIRNCSSYEEFTSKFSSPEFERDIMRRMKE